MIKVQPMLTPFCLIFILSHYLVWAVDSCGNSMFCDSGYHCCSTDTCCVDGSVCAGPICLTIAAIVGIVIGGLSGLSVVASLVAWIYGKLSKKGSVQPNGQQIAQPDEQQSPWYDWRSHMNRSQNLMHVLKVYPGKNKYCVWS